MPGRRLPFSVLAKPAGAACNLDCTYCYFLSKELLADDAGRQMPDDVVRAYLANLFASHPDGPVEVAWQGGEPTLRGLAFFRRAVALAEELRRPRQQVRHVIQTNGTLLDDTWGEFLAEHHFLVGLSVDGPAALHDAHRVDRAGRGTHAQVLRGWQVLRRHGVAANVLCTVNAVNQHHGLAVYRYLRDDLAATHLQFIPVVERAPAPLLPLAEQGWRPGAHGHRTVLYRQHGDRVTSRSVDPVAYGEFLCAVFDEWLAHDVGTVVVGDVEVALGNLRGRHTLCVHSPVCGRSVAVEPGGDVYACDHYVEPGYRRGNVATDAFTDLLAGEDQQRFGAAKLAALPGQCRACPVRWACHGGCPKDRFLRTADGEPGLNYLCAGYHAFFTHTAPALRALSHR